MARISRSPDATLPWVDGCAKCAYYRKEAEWGFISFLLAVLEHFKEYHDIVIIQGAADDVEFPLGPLPD